MASAEKNESKAASVRSSNLELLRVLCGIGVVFQHFCLPANQAAFVYAANAPGKLVLLRLVYSFLRISVNAFMIISGYFLIQKDSRPVGKPLTLLFMSGAYYGIGFVARNLLWGEAMSAKSILSAFIPAQYFAALYVTVYFLSPYLNRLARGLSRRQYRNLMMVLLVLFSVYSTLINVVLSLTGNTALEGVYTVLQTGTGRGFSIVGFVLMYLLGGYLRRFPPEVTAGRQMAGIALCTAVTALVPMALPQLNEALLNYDSVFVVVQAALMVSLFARLHFRSGIVNFTAKSVFGVYLLHFHVLPVVCREISMERICGAHLPNMVLWIILAVGGTFVICVALDWLLRLAASPIARLWKNCKLYAMSLTDEAISK